MCVHVYSLTLEFYIFSRLKTSRPTAARLMRRASALTTYYIQFIQSVSRRRDKWNDFRSIQFFFPFNLFCNNYSNTDYYCPNAR